jgi:hypothetical protein
MRAKLQVASVTLIAETTQIVKMHPVCGKAPFGSNGESEDNTFARYSPSGAFELTITNPDLMNKFKPGKKFYADFTEAAE